MTASIVVGRGRTQTDPEVIDRLITLVDREGIDVVAGMWAESAANTLPGVLWRMYALREQVRVAPELITAHYRAGLIRCCRVFLPGTSRWPSNGPRPSVGCYQRGLPMRPSVSIPYARPGLDNPIRAAQFIMRTKALAGWSVRLYVTVK